MSNLKLDTFLELFDALEQDERWLALKEAFPGSLVLSVTFEFEDEYYYDGFGIKRNKYAEEVD